MKTGPSPPAHILAFIEIMGVDEAVRFCLEFGGTGMMLGRTPSDRSMVAQSFGVEVARKIGAGQYGGAIPQRIPMPKGWLIRQLKHKGLSTADICRKLHVSDTTVHRHLSEAPDKRQGSLFDI